MGTGQIKAVRKHIATWAMEKGFRSIEFSDSPRILTQRQDFLGFERNDLRLVIQCYAKFGDIQLYARCGPRLDIEDDLLEMLRLTYDPRESADIEVLVGESKERFDGTDIPEIGGIPPVILARSFSESGSKISHCLGLLLTDVESKPTLVHDLLFDSTRFFSRTKMSGLRLEILKLVVARRTLPEADFSGVKISVAQSLSCFGIPKTAPTWPLLQAAIALCEGRRESARPES